MSWGVELSPHREFSCCTALTICVLTDRCRRWRLLVVMVEASG